MPYTSALCSLWAVQLSACQMALTCLSAVLMISGWTFEVQLHVINYSKCGWKIFNFLWFRWQPWNLWNFVTLKNSLQYVLYICMYIFVSIYSLHWTEMLAWLIFLLWTTFYVYFEEAWILTSSYYGFKPATYSFKHLDTYTPHPPI